MRRCLDGADVSADFGVRHGSALGDEASISLHAELGMKLLHGRLVDIPLGKLAPAGLDVFYREVAWDDTPVEHLVTAAARYGIEITGPPAR